MSGQENLISFLDTMQRAMKYAKERRDEHTLKMAEAIAVKPATIVSDLDRCHNNSMRNLYDAEARLLEGLIGEYMETFDQDLPQEGHHE